MYKKTHYLFFGLYFLFSLSIEVFGSDVNNDTIGLKEQINLILKKDKNIDVTQDILDLKFTKEIFKNMKLDSETWYELQSRVNFSVAYDGIFQEKPDSAIDVKKFYGSILRFNYNYNDDILQKAQQILNFVVDFYSSQMDFVHAITKAMLGGGFLCHVQKQDANNINQGSSIIPFIISAKKLFDTLTNKNKDVFLNVFGTIGVNEESITKSYGNSGYTDTPQNNCTYQNRVIDYLRNLRKNHTGDDRDIFSLVGWYFLRLYFTGSSVLPQNNLGGFIEKNKGFIQTDSLAALKNSRAKKDIESEVLEWKKAFENFKTKKNIPQGLSLDVKNSKNVEDSKIEKTDEIDADYTESNKEDSKKNGENSTENQTIEKIPQVVDKSTENSSRIGIKIDNRNTKEDLDLNTNKPGTDLSTSDENYVGDENNKKKNPYLIPTIFVGIGIIAFFIYQYRDYFKTLFESVTKTDGNNKITNTLNKV